MKVVIVSGHWLGGGAESVARGLFEYLIQNDIDCYYLYMCGEKVENRRVIKCGYEWEHYVHAASARLFDCDGYLSILSTLNLIRILEKIKPDIVNLHNIVCYSFNYRILFSYFKKNNVKIVWTLHDCWAFTGHCIAIDELPCAKWKMHCEKCPGKKSYPKSYMIDRSFQNFEAKKKVFTGMNNMIITTPSNWLMKCVKESFLQDYDIKVINNGIDVSLFKPVDSDILLRNGLDPHKKTLLCVASRWIKFKGLNFVNDLSQELSSDLFNIVVIGCIDKDHNDIMENIYYVNRTNSVDELVEWYSASDVFLNPTIADTFSMVNLEALACGTPVVTFNTGGSWESVGDECGVLVNEKSKKALISAIEKCIITNISRDVCVKRASNFARDQKYKEYLKLFFEITGY